MKLHVLKLSQPFFNDVFYNKKEFEVRKNDRNFQVGDRLKLVEFPFAVRQRYVLKDIKYILQGGQFGIEKGYVVLGLKEIEFGISDHLPRYTIEEIIKKDDACVFGQRGKL